MERFKDSNGPNPFWQLPLVGNLRVRYISIENKSGINTLNQYKHGVECLYLKVHQSLCLNLQSARMICGEVNVL